MTGLVRFVRQLTLVLLMSIAVGYVLTSLYLHDNPDLSGQTAQAEQAHR